MTWSISEAEKERAKTRKTILDPIGKIKEKMGRFGKSDYPDDQRKERFRNLAQHMGEEKVPTYEKAMGEGSRKRSLPQRG